MDPTQNPEHWRWQIFYYNPADKRIFPPKRNPNLGWTVNFANPKSVLALVAMMLFFALVIFMIEKTNG